MDEKPDQDTREQTDEPKVDPDERFSLYPLATDEALKRLLQAEQSDEQDEPRDSD